MNEKIERRGGRREGAGRPRLGKMAAREKTPVYIRLRPDIVAQIDSLSNSRAQFIERIIEDYFSKQPYK